MLSYTLSRPCERDAGIQTKCHHLPCIQQELLRPLFCTPQQNTAAYLACVHSALVHSAPGADPLTLHWTRVHVLALWYCGPGHSPEDTSTSLSPGQTATYSAVISCKMVSCI